MKTLKYLGLILSAAILAQMLPLNAYAKGKTERVSVSIDGEEGNGNSSLPSISDNGQFITFQSVATNLVPEATNGIQQIFVVDRESGKIELVSVNLVGQAGNDISASPSISADGRFIVFWSLANNLVDNDTNNGEDVFVYNRLTKRIKRVNINNEGEQAENSHPIGINGEHAPSISGNGRYVTYWSSATNLVSNDNKDTIDVFLYDRYGKKTTLVSQNILGKGGNGHSIASRLSTDGKWVGFHSEASNLVNNDLNDLADVFVVNLDTSEIKLISVSSNGEQGNGHSLEPYFSADGRYVAYGSYANNIVPNDTNNSRDVFVYDQNHELVERVSLDNCGKEFKSNTYEVALSGNGRFAVMLSAIEADTSGKGDIWLYDREKKSLEQINVDNKGRSVNGTYGIEDPSIPGISFDGRYVTYWSSATNLVKGDTNDVRDVFVRDRQKTAKPKMSIDLKNNCTADLFDIK